VPLRLVYLRWISKFDETRIGYIFEMKNIIESKIQEVNMKGFMYQIVIASSAAKVWESLTIPEFTQKFWFGRSVTSDWKVGSAVSIVTPEGIIEAKGEVVEFQINKRLSYTWQSSNETIEEISTVVFELQEMGPLTKLTILQDIDADKANFQQAATGWTFILCGLKTFLETGTAMPPLPWKG